MQRSSQNRARRGRSVVSFSSDPKNDGTQEKEDGREGVGEPESNVFFGVGHANLTDESTDVDEEVEPHVDPKGWQGHVSPKVG